MRVLTFNLLTYASADGPSRHALVRRLLPDLQPDVVAFQEVTRRPEFDQAADLLGPEYTILDLPGAMPDHVGECLASRWPLGAVATLDEPLPDAAEDSVRATALATEVLISPPVGRVLVIHHRATYELDRERVREQQALATAAFVENLVREHAEIPVVLLGDLNAGPDAASVRFLTGRQSLGGFSVRYEDAWEAVHGHAPGHTFTPYNALVQAGQMPLERGRRIDHIMIRSGAYGPLLDVADCRLVFDHPQGRTWPSDHYGVLADLRPPAHPPGTRT